MEDLRNKIDEIDREIMILFNRRMEISKQIALTKQKNGLSIENTQRETEVLKNVAALADENTKNYYKALYETILQMSKSYQKEILNKK